MKTSGRLCAGWAKILIGGVSVAFLCGTSRTLTAQANVQPDTVLTAKADSPTLPDAPTPMTADGLPIERSQPLSHHTSLLVDESLQPPGAPSLGDLGLTPADTDGSAQRQALLDKRTHMLKIHQRLGLITVIPVAAACISAIGAPPEHGNYSNTTSRDIHVALGGAAVAMYSATAFYAIRAPKVSNEPARGGVKWHKYLIYIHAPGMILTPILGAMAFNQINSGQKVHGIASAHGAVAAATAISYGAAIVAVSWPIHLKF
jgi:hypothetical protein